MVAFAPPRYRPALGAGARVARRLRGPLGARVGRRVNDRARPATPSRVQAMLLPAVQGQQYTLALRTSTLCGGGGVAFGVDGCCPRGVSGRSVTGSAGARRAQRWPAAETPKKLVSQADVGPNFGCLDHRLAEPAVNPSPTTNGGVGHNMPAHFYHHHVVNSDPPNTTLVPILRRVGATQIVDETALFFPQPGLVHWWLQVIWSAYCQREAAGLNALQSSSSAVRVRPVSLVVLPPGTMPRSALATKSTKRAASSVSVSRRNSATACALFNPLR